MPKKGSKRGKGKGRGRPRKNTASIKQQASAAPKVVYKYKKANPRKGKGRKPGKRARRNPSGAIGFLLSAGVAAVGTSLLDRGINLVVPASIGGYARVGIKLGAAYLVRTNATVKRFVGGTDNANAIALVFATLAVSDIITPFINQTINTVTNALPLRQLTSDGGMSGLVDYGRGTVEIDDQRGMGGLVNIPADSPLTSGLENQWFG